MRHYQGDPYWLDARFNSTGACGHAIKKGERIFYYPRGKKAYCPECSKDHAADFNSHAFDESVYTGNW